MSMLSPSQRPRAPTGVTMTAYELDAAGDGEATEDFNTVGVHATKSSQVSFREFNKENVPEEVFEFSDISDPKKIAAICVKNLPGWNSYSPEDIEITQLMEGLSNQLFKVSLPKKIRKQCSTTTPNGSPDSASCSSGVDTALFRIYGKEVGSFYDPANEFEIFNLLSRYRIGPQLFAHGDGWRIEEWHMAVAVPCRLMGNPSILTQVASQLGRMHKLHTRCDFPRHFDDSPVTEMRLKNWGKEALRVAKLQKGNEDYNRKLQLCNVDEMVEEARWLCNYLQTTKSTSVKGSGMDVVFSHNDSQENNILQTQYGLRLIDFEYAGYNYQAYDIANYFVEFTMDYTEKRWPYYSTNLSAYPSVDSQRLFISVYLSEYLETNVLPHDDEYVLPLLETVQKFNLVSHLLWGLWSVVRAPQAPTFDDFDFLHYAIFRFDTYKRMKREALAKGGEVAVPVSTRKAESSLYFWRAAFIGASCLATGMLLGMLRPAGMLARR
eukprot:TRINITY_DN16704_c0_g1_i2.p1 TRINITY_DN16704_c0_g1~~TRINITY_DN16704_c0_g1_i2.p1  ORF type:complete len:493 (-),score=115.42 TRINITY_DN16704_c0_g1_i2:313-1791(-)